MTTLLSSPASFGSTISPDATNAPTALNSPAPPNLPGFTFDHAYAVVGPRRDVTFSHGDMAKVFPLASVTKLLAAWATLIAVEQKLIDLREPAGPKGSTIRHLLAHCSGLPFAEGAVLARPGKKRIYSNLGIEVLGDVVAEHVGVSFQDWISTSVLSPLEMTATTASGSPAYSGQSSVDDLVKFARELMRPQLLSSQMANEASSVQFPRLSGVLPGYGRQADNRWGLGLEIRGHKNPHWTGKDFSARTFGHFGQSGSFLWVDPTVHKAGIFLGAEPFSSEHKKKWPEFTNRMREL